MPTLLSAQLEPSGHQLGPAHRLYAVGIKDNRPSVCLALTYHVPGTSLVSLPPSAMPAIFRYIIISGWLAVHICTDKMPVCTILNYIVMICHYTYSVTELGIKYCVYLTSSLILIFLCFGLILISPNRVFSDFSCRFTHTPVKVELCLHQICLACEFTLLCCLDSAPLYP